MKTSRILLLLGVAVLAAGPEAAAVYVIGTDVSTTTTTNATLTLPSNVGNWTPRLLINCSTDPLATPVRFALSNTKSQFVFNSYGSTAAGILKNSAGLFADGERLVLGASKKAPGSADTNSSILMFAANRYDLPYGHFYIASNGAVGIWKVPGGPNPSSPYPTPPTPLLDVGGEVKMTVANITGGTDLSEKFSVRSDAEVKPGTVVCIDADNPGKLVVSKKAYDRTVAGIVSGAGDIKPGVTLGGDASADDHHPVALSGKVYCMADTSKMGIAPGDLLTTSDVPGHAMKVADQAKASGAIIGKAMTALGKGEKGLVLVLVSLQ